MSAIDYVIKGGQLSDGTKADVCISGEEIVEITANFSGQSKEVVDAAVASFCRVWSICIHTCVNQVAKMPRQF